MPQERSKPQAKEKAKKGGAKEKITGERKDPKDKRDKKEKREKKEKKEKSKSATKNVTIAPKLNLNKLSLTNSTCLVHFLQGVLVVSRQALEEDFKKQTQRELDQKTISGAEAERLSDISKRCVNLINGYIVHVIDKKCKLASDGVHVTKEGTPIPIVSMSDWQESFLFIQLKMGEMKNIFNKERNLSIAKRASPASSSNPASKATEQRRKI